MLLLTAKLGTATLIPILAGGISLILTIIAVAIIIGIIILFFYIAGKTESLFLAGIVAVPLGFACWPLVSAIKDNAISTVDLAKTVISIVLVLSIGSLTYFGSYAYYIARKRKKEFSEIKLGQCLKIVYTGNRTNFCTTHRSSSFNGHAYLWLWIKNDRMP